MASGHGARVFAAAFMMVGALWLGLTGLCTWNVVTSNGEFEGPSDWPIGLWCMLWSLLPIGLGLRVFAPPRVINWALALIGAAWTITCVVVAAGQVLGRPSDSAGFVLLTIMLLIGLAPGLAILLLGRAGLRSKARPARPVG